jgi:hypothetical protein
VIMPPRGLRQRSLVYHLNSVEQNVWAPARCHLDLKHLASAGNGRFKRRETTAMHIYPSIRAPRPGALRCDFVGRFELAKDQTIVLPNILKGPLGVEAMVNYDM